jgi:subtilisin
LVWVACGTDKGAGPTTGGVPEGTLRPAAKPAGPNIIPGQFIVTLKPGVDPQAFADDVRGPNHEIRHVYSHAINGIAFRGQALRDDPRVAFIEPDLEAHATAQTLPTGVKRIGTESNATANIDGVDDRVDVDIAIIDTGIDLDHPDLNVFNNVNFNNPNKSGDDDNGHGSHVAGIAAAKDNGDGVVGVAPGARLWAVKVLDRRGSGSFSDVIAGIDYVTANASDIEVANMSLSGTGSLASLHNAIKNSVDAGVVYVVAAGNSNKDVYGSDGVFGGNGNDDEIPAAYPEVAAISAMGDTDGQAGGGGSDTSYDQADDTFAKFTNYSESVVVGNPVISLGAAIDLAAPGVDIRSTWKNGQYRTISGTSMSSPHVAGAAALEAVTNGRATNATGVAAIRQALIDAAEAQSAWGSITNDPDANPEGLANVANGPPPPPLSLDITTTSLPAGTVNEVYSATVKATGGTLPYIWAIINGVLPADLSLNTSTGEISGTPSREEAQDFTVEVTDSDQATVATDIQALSITIAPVPPLNITTTSLPAGTVGEAYSATVEASGGTLSYNWTITESTLLPDGLSLNTSTGEISGTPTTPTTEETQNFTVEVTDGTNTESKGLSITVGSPPTVATHVSVDDISYATQGGRNGGKNLLITVALKDNLQNPVAGASVSIDLLNEDTSQSWLGSGTTGSDGTVTFSLKNAPSGSYKTTVTDVTAAGLTWDETSPANGFDKESTSKGQVVPAGLEVVR